MSAPFDNTSREDVIAQLRAVISRLKAETPEVSPGQPAFDGGDALSRAQSIYSARRERERALPVIADLFHDPAWDIVLDLFIASEKGTLVSVSSACIGAVVAPTTALRVIATLTDRGVLERESDLHDKRRCYVRLSDAVREQVRAYFVGYSAGRAAA